MCKFSIVCPVKDEVDLIPRTLPSLFSVGASEVILGVDNDIDKRVLTTISEVADKHSNCDVIIKFHGKNHGWVFHQAYVRRKCFEAAKHDKILTTDIDLVINKNILKAVKMVGENNTGLVSLQKLFYPGSVAGFYRELTKQFKRLMVDKYKHKGFSTFTGLYALYRPYWLDSEEGIKELPNPKQKVVLKREDLLYMGEDTFLRECMSKKHKTVYLRDVGAVSLNPAIMDSPKVCYESGRFEAVKNTPLRKIIIRSVLYAKPHYLRGYLFEKNVRWK